jgi:hypothetical protein
VLFQHQRLHNAKCYGKIIMTEQVQIRENADMAYLKVLSKYSNRGWGKSRKAPVWIVDNQVDIFILVTKTLNNFCRILTLVC